MIPKWTPIALLAVVLFLGYSYGNERARRAGQDAEIARLTVRGASEALRTDSLRRSYSRAIQRADSLSRLVPALRERRGRAVASSDSAVARVDSAVAYATPDSLVPLRIAVALRASLLSERAASSALVLSLESSVSALRLAIVSADSVIASQASVIASQAALVQVLERQAHPSLLARSLAFARHAAVGAAVALVWVAVR